MLAANDCRVVFTFLQRSPSFSLASASRFQHDNESWHARQRVYLTKNYNLNSYDSRTRAWADVFRQKTKPYRNVARQSFLIFSIFVHQISCRRAQSKFETTSTKSEACPTMPCISLVVSLACGVVFIGGTQHPLLEHTSPRAEGPKRKNP